MILMKHKRSLSPLPRSEYSGSHTDANQVNNYEWRQRCLFVTAIRHYAGYLVSEDISDLSDAVNLLSEVVQV